MDVNCLRIVENQAVLSGTVTKITVKGPVPSFIFVGYRGAFKVTDNGEGGDAPADLISDVVLFPAASCAINPVPYIL
jgi:hypothetical protein